jgi:two-component system OmpR family sensor kinase
MTLSLRTRLLAGVLGLVSVALVVAAGAIYAEQRSFLYGRLDQRVIAAATPISFQLGVDARRLRRPAGKGSPGGERPAASPLGKGLAGFLPSGTYGALVDRRGRILRGPVTISNGEQRLSAPAFPKKFRLSHADQTPELFSVDSIRGKTPRYRVAALPLESGAGTVIVALPLDELDDTLHELVLVESLVVGVLILALTVLGWVVIRIGLRPLGQMERVASEIADGDLSRRVSPATAHTEIGRLGLSLNKMLVRIEEAFADRARSEERRKRFLADASHELRTPLASLRGYAELFRLGPAQDPAALERAMARIEAEAARMGALVEDLLLLASLDELPEARRVRVDLSELCAQAAADARAVAPDRGITLRSADRVTAIGDPDGLRQVLANLVGNALIHTPAGTPVELEVRREGNETVLEVRDHGPGIPADAGARVFDRFWREEVGRTRGRAGAGLGLAIVREIVDAHHGTVAAANDPAGGAVFSVRLPAAEGGERTTAPADGQPVGSPEARQPVDLPADGHPVGSPADGQPVGAPAD